MQEWREELDAKSQVDLKCQTMRAGVTQLLCTGKREVSGKGRAIEGGIISHTLPLKRRGAMGGKMREGRNRDEWGEEIQKRNTSHTTTMVGEETLGVQAPEGRIGEAGKVTTVGGAPSRGQILAGHSLLTKVEDGLVSPDPGKLSFKIYIW